MSIIHHVQDWQDLAYGAVMKYRGRSNQGRDSLPLSYDLEELKTSPEFTHINRTIHRHMMSMSTFSKRIKKMLQDFLSILEEYD